MAPVLSKKKNTESIQSNGCEFLHIQALTERTPVGGAIKAPDELNLSNTNIAKEAESLGVPGEEGHRCAQAVKVGETIYLSGQAPFSNR